MALIDVVKCSMGTRELISKFPSDDLRLGTQLVVYPGQTAFFVKGGQILDEFEAGTYTLKSANIPLLSAFINLPFGSQSPFKAEVWYINTLAILDSKWGTATPLQIEDPKYEVIVPLRAYGQYGFKIENPRLFLESLVGNMTAFTTEKLNKYFKAKIMSLLNSSISNKLTKDGISILNINSHLHDIATYCKQQISLAFQKYGLEMQEFDVVSITPRDDDKSFQKLKEAKDLAARLKITGRDIYQMERSFDVLDTASQNEGAAGSLINAGLGLGVGMNVGNQMGNVVSKMNTNPSALPPPLPVEKQYYVAINGQQSGPYDKRTIEAYILNGSLNAMSLIWSQGMPGWDKIMNVPDFASVLNPNCPPPLPNI